MSKYLFLIFIFTKTFTFAQIINIEEKRIKTRDSVRWYGECSLSASFLQLNKNVLTLRGSTQVEYKKNKNLFLLIGDYALLKGGNEAFENAAFQHFRYNYKLKPKLTLEFFEQIQDNKIQHINLRALLGGGVRWRIYKSQNEKNRLYFGAAYMQEYNQFKGNSEASFNRISSYLSGIYEPNTTVKLISTTYYQPDILNLKNARLSSQNTCFFKINKRLSFKIDFNIAYDPTLPQGIKYLTYSWINGLRWVI